MTRDLPDKSGSIQFKLAAGVIEVDANVLEKMKLALQRFFDKPESEFPKRYLELRDHFRRELQSSACWIDQGLAWVGAWKLEAQVSHLELVRYPPPDQGRYLFHATLEQRGNEWVVIAFETEHEFGPD